MKKISCAVNGTTQSIYSGIDRVYGGWIATTEGNPTCLNELEEAGAASEIKMINALISTGEEEDLSADDIEYINSTLEAWGI